MGEQNNGSRMICKYLSYKRIDAQKSETIPGYFGLSKDNVMDFMDIAVGKVPGCDNPHSSYGDNDLLEVFDSYTESLDADGSMLMYLAFLGFRMIVNDKIKANMLEKMMDKVPPEIAKMMEMMGGPEGPVRPDVKVVKNADDIKELMKFLKEMLDETE